MSIEYINPVNSEEVKKQVEERQKGYIETARVMDIITEALKPFEGKQMTKRIETALVSLLPDYSISFRAEYGMYRITLYDRRKGWDDRYSLLLGYESEGKTYSRKNFLEYNKGYLNSMNEYNSLEVIKPMIEQLTDEWNNGLKILQNVNKQVSMKYPLASIFDIQTR